MFLISKYAFYFSTRHAFDFFSGRRKWANSSKVELLNINGYAENVENEQKTAY